MNFNDNNYRDKYLRFLILCHSIIYISTAQCTFTTTAPYFENFSSITTNNQLPNCSWTSSNIGNTCFTYTANGSLNRTGRIDTKFASFYYLPAGDNYFFTNGVQLIAGVTYSASVWYTTEPNGYTNWTDLSILMSASQTTTNLTSIVSTSGPAWFPVYTSLSNTFTVATTGLYYFAVRATSSGSCCANYLSWDDFAITVPCTSVAPSSTAICVGQSATITASEATTYTWNTGSNSSSIVVSPLVNTIYTVTATNTLAGCTTAKTVSITVYQNPPVNIYAPINPICSGEAANLLAFGANTYSWTSNAGGATTATALVTPSVNTTYTVTGTNQVGCSSRAALQVTVLPSPSLTIAVSNSFVCENEPVTITASGASTYTWATPEGPVVLPAITITLNVSGVTFAVAATGTTNSCVSNSQVTINVADCTDIYELSANAWKISVFPNPGNGEGTVLSEKIIDVLEVYDLMGHLIKTMQPNTTEFQFYFPDLKQGMYLIKIQSQKREKLVKYVIH